MKKLLFLTLVICASKVILARANPSISGNHAPCTCIWSQNYFPKSMLHGRSAPPFNTLDENHKYLQCSCPGKRLTTAFPNSFIENGVTLIYESNTGKLKMTTPKEITICDNYDGCGGYCNIGEQGNPSCVWGSRAPLSWFVKNQQNYRSN